MAVFFLFLLALAAGILSTLFWIPEQDLGRGYFQMNALIVLGLLGLAGAILLLHPLRPFGERPLGGGIGLATASLAALLYWAAVWRERWRVARASALVALAASAAVLLAAGLELPGGEPVPGLAAAYGVAALASSAALLGWALVTMLLGHWYLVAPRLAFRHLVVFCWTLLGTVGLRCLTVAAALWGAWRLEGAGEPSAWTLLAGFQGQGMFLWFRLLWGLVIPLGLGLMSLHCARQRSNQSATGILYVLVVGALIGEITAYYLTATTGVPV
ncbi:MAG: hypothetical protein ACRD0X_02335 [Thermoanaerobaculia bacterium]